MGLAVQKRSEGALQDVQNFWLMVTLAVRALRKRACAHVRMRVHVHGSVKPRAANGRLIAARQGYG